MFYQIGYFLFLSFNAMNSGINIAHSKANIISVKEKGSSRGNLSPA